MVRGKRRSRVARTPVLDDAPGAPVEVGVGYVLQDSREKLVSRGSAAACSEAVDGHCAEQVVRVSYLEAIEKDIAGAGRG